MNMSSSSVEFNGVEAVPIRALVYHDMATPPLSNLLSKAGQGGLPDSEAGRRRAEVELSQDEFHERLRAERADAAAQVEARLRQEYELKLEAARAPIAAVISEFETQRNEYYARVEAELIHLSLAIATKILHREAQVDPMLVATLVRMALEKLREGSSVTIRVGRGRGLKWKKHFADQSNGARVHVVEDAELNDHDCLLETELGVANFGLDAQLKEVEQGFFDLLALRPVKG
jgi:flagellar assembly protein FliH